jgi:predicted  nucleic acid-binding Zn-ribbon protein
MLTDDFKNLLILQERDISLAEVETELAAVPKDRKDLETAKKSFLSQVEDKKDAIKQLTVKSNEIASRTEELKAKRVKYKTQQITVKKNDELQALEAEIQNLEKSMSEMDDEALEILMNIDSDKEELVAFEKEVAAKVEEIEDQLIVLKDREKELQGLVEKAKNAKTAAEEAVSQKFFRAYEQVKRQVKPPYVVALNGTNCSGCHLKVSNDIQSLARDTMNVTNCDQCNRILYKG